MPSRPPGYSRLREFVGIDPAELDNEVIKHPPLFLEVCEQAADAAEERDIAINTLDYEKGKLRRELRDGTKKMTNDAIDAEVATDKIILACITTVEVAKHNVAVWNGLLEAYRAKASSLKRLGELMHAGYSASSSLLKTPRERISESREESNRRTRRDV